jgi:hypothetical protein
MMWIILLWMKHRAERARSLQPAMLQIQGS